MQITSSFTVDICTEYLEESSFLYEQRLSLFDDPEITWLETKDFEDRFEAHIDGLVVGEDLALEVCKQQASEGDFGELHAAVRVFCRQNRKDLVLEILEQLDPEDKEKLVAVADALKYELPDSWQNDFIAMLHGEDPKLLQIAARVAGHRRLAAGQELIHALQQNTPDLFPDIIGALGRIREQSARALLLNNLENDRDDIRSAAVLALLRIGESQTLDRFFGLTGSQQWTHIPIGLGGGPSAVPALLRMASGESAHADCLTALGLLGDTSAIDVLLSKLDNKELAESAAIGLNLITGADLYEEAFIPEEMEEDELFEEELEDFRNGKKPVRPDGQPYGITITRLSQNRGDWQNWWSKNKSRLSPQIRYRNGKPYSPACLLENLESEKSPNRIRRLAYEELVIRHGIDFPFEVDMLVTEQKRIIGQYAAWIKANGSSFHDGQWYFAGRIMT